MSANDLTLLMASFIGIVVGQIYVIIMSHRPVFRIWEWLLGFVIAVIICIGLDTLLMVLFRPELLYTPR